MQNFMKTIISAVQTWTKGEIKDSVADWNENDANADSYVKNRTHWSDGLVEKVILEQQTVMNRATISCEIVNGQTYKVTWDNQVYQCVAWKDGYLGNAYIIEIGSSSNEPFAIGGNRIFTFESGEHTIEITTTVEGIHKLDSKYLDLPTNIATTDDVQGAMDVANAAQTTADGKMDATNPVGTGSFSMNRKPDTIVGDYSHAEGNGTTASGSASHAEGYWTVASGEYSHAEGNGTTASGSASHAEGYWTVASGDHSHAEGEGSNASGYYSHAEGWRTTASGTGSHAEGDWTVASGACQHVQGEYNIIDTPVSDTNPKGKYAHIVGNGIGNDTRSNAHTLDWDGNAWFQGAVKIGGTGQDDEAAKEVATKEYVDNAEFVSYNPQTLTDEQKAQARANIDRYVWHTFSDSYGTYTYTLDPTKNFNYELAQTVANTSNNGSISALEDIVSWLSLLARCSYKTPGASNEVIENVAKNFDAIKNSGAGMSLSFYYQHTGHNGLGASVDVGLHPGDGYVVVTIYNGYADFHASFSYNSETNTTTEKYLNRRFADKTLSKEGYYADAKAVGDAISQISSQSPNCDFIAQDTAPENTSVLWIDTSDGSSGSSQNLNPVTKTDDMTQAVGVDSNGLLWTAPTAGNSGSDSGSGGTTVTENVVGATPFEVTKDGLYIRPEVATRVYNVSDGVENLMEQFQTVKTYADQIVYGTTSKTVIEAQSKVEGANPPVIAHVYGYAAEPGDYTLLVTSTTRTFIRVKKRANTSNMNTEPGTNVAEGYTNSIINFTVTEADVASHPCNIGVQITIASAVLPDTYTIKLVKGKHDAIPDGVSLEFQVEAGQKFSLNPFKGITAYADPVANVYEAVESESGSTGSTETTSGTLLCFGDSLTATRYSMYPEMLTEMGMNAINFGVSGMQLRAVDSPYCMCSIVDALKAGDMTAQIEGGENANYANLLSLIPTATGIVIWYGTNDYNGDCVFEGEGTNTIEGALRYVLTELFTLYPKKAIYVVSPFMYTYAYGHQPENPNGTVAEMIEVMRGVCEEFAVPFIDMSRESGFNQITRLTLTSDQLHPDTTAGRERLAKFMYGKLRSLGC